MTGTMEVLFAPEKVKHLEAENTLPAKFGRMLDKAGIADLVRGKKVCIKMHLGGNLGYTTIHPLFVRVLVDKIKKSGAKSVFVTDGGTRGAEIRGYTRKAIGCPIKAEFGPMRKTVNVPINYKTFDTADIAKLVLDADVLVVFSHVKGHGDCGFGGAGKNIAMGTIPGSSRGKIHALEGGIEWDEEKCKHCNKCIEECPNKANKFDEKTKKYTVFWHDCKYCRHCILACPEQALSTKGATFDDFQEGMARVIKQVLDHFRDHILFINVLKQITIFCDCWGFSTPSLVPDIGILASKDLVAIDRASLDMIKEENLLSDGLPADRTLGEGNHLFEKIHGKNPYLLGEILETMGNGSTKYDVIEIE